MEKTIKIKTIPVSGVVLISKDTKEKTTFRIDHAERILFGIKNPSWELCDQKYYLDGNSIRRRNNRANKKSEE